MLDADAGTIECDCTAGGVFHDAHGLTTAKWFAVVRPHYTFEKDAEFAGRPAHLFEGAMHLRMLGMSTKRWAKLLNKPWYRVTAHDVKGDGSRLQRLTWWDVDGREPQPRANADPEWTYTMKRVIDGNGNVDMGVVADIKRLFGPTGFVLARRF